MLPKAQISSWEMIHRRNIIIIIFLAILYIPLALPFIIRGMIRTQKWAFVLWACFMGIIAMLYPPVGDFYRYAIDYYIYKDMDFGTFFLLTTALKFDFFLSFISYGFGKICLPIDIVRFLYNFIGYLLIGFIYIDIVSQKKPYPNRKTRILLLGFFMSFMLVNFVFRYSFSMSLFIYGSYKILEKNKKNGWIFIILSVISHFSYLLFACSLFILRIPLLKLRKEVILLIVILLVLLGDLAVKSLINFLPSDLANHYNYYVDGYWATDYLKDHSEKFQIMSLLNNVIVYACVGIYIYIYPKHPNKLTNWVNSLLLIAVISTPFKIMLGRFLTVLMWGIKMFFLIEYKNTPKFYNSLKFLFVMVMLSNIINIWSSRRQLSISDENLLLYRPTITLFAHNYDKNWINQNVDEEGGLTKIKY